MRQLLVQSKKDLGPTRYSELRENLSDFQKKGLVIFELAHFLEKSDQQPSHPFLDSGNA